MMITQHISHRKGGLFSYIGELRIVANGAALIDYTGWTLASRIEDKNGVVLPYLTFEWVDITNGVVRVYIPAADTNNFRAGSDYKMYLVPITPASDPLPPYIISVAFQDT